MRSQSMGNGSGPLTKMIKSAKSKVHQSLMAKISRPVEGKTPTVSQPADATHRRTNVKKSANKQPGY